MTDAELAEIERREERAHDELMRVTGMGKYAENVRGGPPQPRRASIPARPDYDTDLVIGASLRDRTALVAEVRWLRAVVRDLATCGRHCVNTNGPHAADLHERACVALLTECERAYPLALAALDAKEKPRVDAP